MGASVVTASDALSGVTDTASRLAQAFNRKGSDAFLVPSIVQSAKNVANATTVTVTFGATPTPGNVLVFGVGWNVTSSTITPPTGVTLIGSNTTGHGIATYQRVVQAGDGTGWTFGISVSGQISVIAYEVFGVDNATPVNGHGENSLNVQVLTTASVVPTKLNCLPIAFFADGNRNAFTGLNGDWVNDANNTLTWFNFGSHGPGTTNTTSGITASINLTGGPAASNTALVLLNSAVVSPNETLARTQAFPRTVSDALGVLTESVNRAIQGFTRTATDGLGSLSESVVRAAQAVHRTTLDAMSGVAESITRSAQGFVRTTSDVLGSILETLTSSGIHHWIVTASDALPGIVESATRAVQNLIRSTSDGVGGVVDSLVRAVGNVRTGNDVLSAVTDGVTRGVQSFTRSVSDAVGVITEGLTRSSHVSRTAGDAIGSLGDSLIRSAQNFVRSSSDGIGSIADQVIKTIRATSYYYLSATINAVVAMSASILSSVGITSSVATNVAMSVSIPSQVALPVTIQASIVLPVRIT